MKAITFFVYFTVALAVSTELHATAIIFTIDVFERLITLPMWHLVCHHLWTTLFRKNEMMRADKVRSVKLFPMEGDLERGTQTFDVILSQLKKAMIDVITIIRANNTKL